MTTTQNTKIDYWKTYNDFTFENVDVKQLFISFLRGYNIGFFSPLVQKIWCEGRLLGGNTEKGGEEIEIIFDHLELPREKTEEITFSGTALFTQTETKAFVKGRLFFEKGEVSGSVHIPKDDEFEKFIETVSVKKKWIQDTH